MKPAGDFCHFLLKVRELKGPDGGDYIGAYVTSLWTMFENDLEPKAAIETLAKRHAAIKARQEAEAC